MNKMNLSDKVFYLRMESKSEDDIRNYIKFKFRKFRS
mgnify:CR=1 FL=1